MTVSSGANAKPMPILPPPQPRCTDNAIRITSRMVRVVSNLTVLCTSADVRACMCACCLRCVCMCA